MKFFQKLFKKTKPHISTTKKEKKPQNLNIEDIAIPELSKQEMLQQAYARAAQRTAPKIIGAAMDALNTSASFSGTEGVNANILCQFARDSSFIGYHAMSVIAQNWLIQAGCSLRPRDAARNWYDISCDGDLDNDAIAKIESLDKEYKLKQNVIEACTNNNIFGIRHVLFKHKNPNFDYSLPFDPDDFLGGNYAGMVQIDPYWIIAEFEQQSLSNPASMHFYEPTWWTIQSRKYHMSHFVILRGDNVADYLKPTYKYGGISMTQKAYHRVYAAERTANETPALVQSKRLNVLKSSKPASGAGCVKDRILNRLTGFAKLRDNFGTFYLHDSEEFTQIETSLTDLDTAITRQYEIVAAIFGEPVSRLMGTGHGGLGTGDTDNAYSLQKQEELRNGSMSEIARAHYLRLIPSEFGMVNIDISPMWRPLHIISESERAQIRLSNAQADQIYYNMGAIDNIDARQKIIEDEHSGYNNLDMPDEIEEVAAQNESEQDIDK